MSSIHDPASRDLPPITTTQSACTFVDKEREKQHAQISNYLSQFINRETRPHYSSVAISQVTLLRRVLSQHGFPAAIPTPCRPLTPEPSLSVTLLLCSAYFNLRKFSALIYTIRINNFCQEKTPLTHQENECIYVDMAIKLMAMRATLVRPLLYAALLSAPSLSLSENTQNVTEHRRSSPVCLPQAYSDLFSNVKTPAAPRAIYSVPDTPGLFQDDFVPPTHLARLS